MLEAQIDKFVVDRGSKDQLRIPNPAIYAIYVITLAVCISTWFAAVRAPLFLDETGTYWQISAGLSQIWSRQYLCFPAYNYLLWFATKVFGTSEAALRTPSLLAMLGAVWLMYRIARELFDRDVAVLSTIIFCIHPIILFASINIRPYAFGALAVNGTIFVLLKLRRSDSNYLAALFGFLAACILYSHYLFAGILPALLFCFFVFKMDNRKVLWRQLSIAAAVFVVACLPIIPGLRSMFATSGAHVYSPPPAVPDLISTFAPGFIPFIIGAVVLLAGVVAARTPLRSASQVPLHASELLFCASLALIPVLLLYLVSVSTPIHMFEARHRLAAVPGIALCWGLLIRRYLTHGLRLVLCLALLMAVVYRYDISAFSHRHVVTWKYALQFAEKNASSDNAPVVICSSFPESNFAPMPLQDAKESNYFSQLSYYKLTVPVVPLPRALNDQAIHIGSQFLAQAAHNHRRFLALADQPSYGTLDWLAHEAAASYQVRSAGIFDETKVLEFIPRVQSRASP